MFLFANKLFIALVLMAGAVLVAYFVQREEGVATPAVENDWVTSWNEAVVRSTETQRPIFMLFTGSDWCPPCKMLEEQALQTQAFADFAEANLVLLMYDLPRSGSISMEAQGMVERFDGGRLPTYLVVQPDGRVLARNLGVPRGGAAGLIAFIEQATKRSAAADQGTAKAAL